MKTVVFAVDRGYPLNLGARLGTADVVRVETFRRRFQGMRVFNAVVVRSPSGVAAEYKNAKDWGQTAIALRLRTSKRLETIYISSREPVEWKGA